MKQQTQNITQLLTKQHHSVIEQFLNFKERTLARVAENKDLWAVIEKLETKLAQKTPVLEAEYAIDDQTSLSLYDCLVPKLKEHRRFRIQKDD